MDLEKNEKVFVKSKEMEGKFVGEAEEEDKVLVDLAEEHSHRGVIEIERELVEKIEQD